MSYVELIVDTEVPQGDEVMHILPSKLKSTKYLASNTFDLATIKNCPVEKISSGGLVGIFSCLKPLAKINVIVFQPIAVMLCYDSKQIEANLKLAGFEKIQTRDVTITDDKTGKMIQTQSIEATKPESKRNPDINIEVIKAKYKQERKPVKEEPPRNRFNVGNVTTKTTTTTTTTTKTDTSGYKPRNKTYVKQEVKQITEEPKTNNRRRIGQSTENTDNTRYKNRTYVRTTQTTTTTTSSTNNKNNYNNNFVYTSNANDGKGRATGYYQRRNQYSSSTTTSKK